MKKLLIGILSIVTVFQLISSHLSKHESDQMAEELYLSSLSFECPSPVPAVHFDLENCSAILDNTDSDYSEFTAEFSELVTCANFSVVGDFLFRNRPEVNRHSCTPGVEEGTVAMCVSALDTCGYFEDSERAIRFNIEVDPIDTDLANIGGLSFYEQSPDEFVWLNGPSGQNNPATLYGLRVLKDGVEIFRQVDIPTEREWSFELFDFSDIPEFNVTETAIFSFELLAYCLEGNGAEVSVWDIDEISILTCCGDDCTGHQASDLSFEVLVDSCVGSDVHVTLMDQTSINNPNLGVVSWEWTVVNGTQTFNFVGPVVNAVLQNEETSISLLATLFNGCTIQSESLFFENGVLPEIEASGTLFSCNDVAFYLDLFSSIDDSDFGSDVTSVSWQIQDGGELLNLDGANVSLDVNNPDLLGARVTYIYENNCVVNSPVITSFDEEPLALDIVPNITTCNESSFVVEFENTFNIDGDIDVVSNIWTVSLNGEVTTSTEEKVSVTFEDGDQLIVNSEVIVVDGCVLSDETIFDENIYFPQFEITTTPLNCSGDDITLEVDLLALNNPMGFDIESVQWTVNINGVSSAPFAAPFEITVNLEDQVYIFATIVFTNGCAIEVDLIFDGDDISLDPTISFTVADCMPGDDVFQSTFEAISSIPNVGFNSANWTFVINGESTELSGTVVDIAIPLGADFTVTLDIEYANGCVGSISESNPFFNPQPEVEISLSVNDCVGDSVNVQLVPLFLGNSSVEVESFNWVVDNGGNVILSNEEVLNITLLNVNSSVSLIVAFESGCFANLSQNFDNGFLDVLELKGTALQCDGDDFSVNYIACLSDSSGMNISSVSWNIITNEGPMTFTGDSISFSTSDINNIEVSAFVIADNSCEITATADLPPSVFSPTLEINSQIDDCLATTFDVQLFNVLTDNGGFEPVSFDWQVDDGSTILNFDSETINVEIGAGDTLVITSSVKLFGTCTLSDTFVLTSDGEQPENEILFELLECPDDDSVVLNITNSETLPTGFEIEDEEWSISFNALELTFDTDPLGITLPQGTEIIVSHELFFTNGCNVIVLDTLLAEDLIPQASFDIEVLNCDSIDGDMVEILISNTSGIPPFEVDQIEWNIDLNGQVSVFDTETVMINADINDILIINQMVLYSNGCRTELTDSVLIEIPSIEFSGDTVFDCTDADVFLVTNPNPEFEYEWDPEDGLIFPNGDMSNPIANVEENTTFFVTVTNDLCSITDSIEVIVSTMDTILFTQSDVDCDGVNIIEIEDPLPGIVYVWSLTEDFSDIFATGNSIEVPADSTTYYVSFSNLATCTDGFASVIPFNFTLNITAQNPMVFCEGDTMIYNIINNDPNHDLTVLWEDDIHIISPLDQNPITVVIFEGDELFTLSANIENQFGCDTTIVVDFMEGMMESLDFTYTLDCETLEVCFLQTTAFSGDVLWDFGDPATDSDISSEAAPCYVYPVTGEYTVTLMSDLANCNTLPIQKTIDVIDEIEIEIGADTNVIFETKELELIVLNADDGFEYIWNTGETTPTIVVSPQVGTTTFSVTVTDANGCMGVDSFDVEVREIQCNEDGIYIPNAFSPNGDGVNDVFRVRSNCLTSIDFTVYNRWGEEIFHTTDPNEGWDGRYLSKPVPPDAFAYCLIAVCATGENYETRGNVSLLR